MSSPWLEVPLGEILKRRKDEIDIQPLQTYKRLTIRMNGKGIVVRDHLVGSEIGTKRQFVVESGQLVLSKIDARNGAFGVLPQECAGAIITGNFWAFDPDSARVDVRYLRYLTMTPLFLDFCIRASEGTTNRRYLQEPKFLAQNVPLPPLDEQSRIVSRINDLGSKVQEAMKRRNEASLAVAALRAAYLSQLVTADQASSGRLGDVLLAKPRNGWSARCTNADIGVPVLSLGAVTGFDYRNTEFKRTTESTSPNAHYWLRKGDLLITRSNTPELVGHAAIYDGSPSPCIYPDLMMRLIVDETRADRYFVHHWLMSPTVRDYVRRKAKGTSPTMKKISQGIVMGIPFPTALTLHEQRRMVGYLDHVRAKTGTLSKLQSETTAELDAMIPSILDKAFRGEL